MWRDESLEHWGQVFMATGLYEHGITFGEFLEDPSGYLAALGPPCMPAGLAGGDRPLLPRQRRVARRLWQRWEWEAN